MPIDPESGLYVPPAPSRFPGGIFGDALQINNNVIGGQLAAEAASRRALQDHLLEIQTQAADESLNDSLKDRRAVEDQRSREEQFRTWVQANPGAQTDEMLKKAMGYGVKDTTLLGNMVYREGLIGAKEEKNQIDRSKEARLEVQELFQQGFTGSEIADQLEPKYGDQSGISPLYWQKIRTYKQSPMAQATISEKGGRTDAAQAEAAKDRAKAAAGPASSSDTEVDKMLFQYDKAIAAARAKVAQLPILQQRTATKQLVEPLVLTRDQYATKYNRPLSGSKAPAPVVPGGAPPGLNPSPSTTPTQPAAPPVKKYKPNMAYGDGQGNVLFYTDAQGNRIN
ncbi:MAG: hypothetical protein L0170_17970 [Acidobacteria bacterium]|nr:hypothetical protein [Acidobacteriota bacterium]